MMYSRMQQLFDAYGGVYSAMQLAYCARPTLTLAVKGRRMPMQGCINMPAPVTATVTAKGLPSSPTVAKGHHPKRNPPAEAG